MSQNRRIECGSSSFSGRTKVVPDTTNHGEKVAEVCEKAFPISMTCKFCDTEIRPSEMFLFSCRHYYHGFCARQIIFNDVDGIECKRCTKYCPEKDWQRIRVLPLTKPPNFDEQFITTE